MRFMDRVQLIVEAKICENFEKKISGICRIKYKLPTIGLYVLEAAETEVERLKGMEGVRSVRNDTCITAQAVRMDYTGAGITIAILDTGVSLCDDLVRPRNRLLAFVDYVNGKSHPYDDNAHGTHVSCIAAGNGFLSHGRYRGTAPEANIAAIKILDENGRGNTADALAGIEWIIKNRRRYNIRVANLSIGTEDTGSSDPLVRAVEEAWDRGIVMCIAAGNNGPAPHSVTSPGISRKAITVGASDDFNHADIWGNTLVNFSGRGPTSECINKPDILAPGHDIISCLSSSPEMSAKRRSKLKIVAEHYVKMSGTSMASPMIAGAAALLLQKHPGLTPDEVKLMMKKSAKDLGQPGNRQGWGEIDIEKLLNLEVEYVRRKS